MSGSKSAVKGCFERIAVVNGFHSIQHRFNQGGIGWITFKNQTVQYQVRNFSGKANLVSVKRITVVLANNISMRFKNRYNFFWAGTFLPILTGGSVCRTT
ncbi:MAG: hypothetical protein SRB2_02225 [Desulfobacteraceae bacterium Eth-SRB2]|nr:MAG: hypothetical protein SRB2_02225 [Desulfobacteraceae bacterium Eth-SRB2]